MSDVTLNIVTELGKKGNIHDGEGGRVVAVVVVAMEVAALVGVMLEVGAAIRTGGGVIMMPEY